MSSGDSSAHHAVPEPEYARLPVTAGYSALRESAAWQDLSDRGRIIVRGEDRARLLHAMTTNHVQQLTPGTSCYAFFLNAQGRILADVNILCFEDHFLLDTEPETRKKVYEHLDRYIIADDVTLEDVTDSTGLIAVEGPHAAGVIERLGVPAPSDTGRHLAWEGGTVARLSTTGGEGFFLIGDSASREQVIARLKGELRDAGAIEAQPQDFRTVRIEHGHPRYGEEITERYLVQETGQLQAVHFSKGCYLGQEIVERVRSRAQIHRILRGIEMETDRVPEAGTKFSSGDAAAGEIASATFSPALGKTVALAYVRTQFAEPGTHFLIDGSPAQVRNLAST